MPHVRDADGNVVADDLTPAEIDRLRQEGVPVTSDDDGDDPGGEGGEGGEGGDPAPDDPAPDDGGGSGSGGDPADDAPAPDDDGGEGGSGSGGDPADDAPDPDDEPDDDTGGGRGGSGGDPWDDDDPRDDEGDTGDGEGGGGDPADDGDHTPDDDTDADGGGDPTDGEPIDLDDLDDPDEWDEWDDGDGEGDPIGDTPDDTPDDDPDTGGNDPSDPGDPGDLDDAIDDMLDRSDARDVSDRVGDAGLDANDDMWKDRLDRIRSASDIPEATKARDERAGAAWFDPFVPTDEYRPWAEGSGFIDDLVERFSKIKEAPKPSNAMRGSDLDRKRLTRFRSGDARARNFYLRSNGDRTKARRSVGVAVDLSGSMSDPADGDLNPFDPDIDMDEVTLRLHMAKVAVAGLAHAVETIGDTFTASGFTSGHYDHPNHEACAPLITAPGEQFDWWQLDAVSGSNKTPMAYGVRKAAQRLLRTDQPEKTLFVIADGQPTRPAAFSNVDEDDVADPQDGIASTAAVVRKAREAGVEVVGVGIGDVNQQAIHRMFRKEKGQDPDDAPWIMADADTLPAELAELYEDTL